MKKKYPIKILGGLILGISPDIPPRRYAPGWYPTSNVLTAIPLTLYSIMRVAYTKKIFCLIGWLRSTVVECRSVASELSLSCARPVAAG